MCMSIHFNFPASKNQSDVLPDVGGQVKYTNKHRKHSLRRRLTLTRLENAQSAVRV